jgi:hypothetical protein
LTNAIVFARMPKKDVELLRKVSHNRGEDISDFVRRSIYKELASLSYLAESQKKALGIVTKSFVSTKSEEYDGKFLSRKEEK